MPRSNKFIRPGSLGENSFGRFFVLKTGEEYAEIFYEGGIEAKVKRSDLCDESIPWRFSSFDTIPKIRDALRLLDVVPSGNVFTDHDVAARSEKKKREVKMADMRRRLVESKPRVPTIEDYSGWGEPPEDPSITTEDLSEAQREIETANIVVDRISWVFYLGWVYALVAYFIHEVGDGAPISFKHLSFLEEIRLVLILAIVPPVFFLVFTIGFAYLFTRSMIESVLWQLPRFRAVRAIVEQHSNLATQWSEFLKSQLPPLDAWCETHAMAIREYHLDFSKYVMLRHSFSVSNNVRRLFYKHYPLDHRYIGFRPLADSNIQNDWWIDELLDQVDGSSSWFRENTVRPMHSRAPSILKARTLSVLRW